MIKLILKAISAVLLLALVIICFIKILPWFVATVALLALVKYCHDWLCHQGITPSAWWSWWKKDHGPQNAA